MEEEEDNLCEHPSNIDSDTSENHRYQDMGDNTDVENLTDTDQTNGQSKGDQHNDDEKQSNEPKYSTNYQTARGDLSSNWRVKAVTEEQDEESEETDKPIYDSTRQSRGARFSSQFGYNKSKTTKENQYNEESEQKLRYGFTRQSKGSRFSSQTGFSSRDTRGLVVFLNATIL
ncbi:uncharacterized protein ACNLHF_022699 [Anomaloglossus baeobatrachus]